MSESLKQTPEKDTPKRIRASAKKIRTKDSRRDGHPVGHLTPRAAAFLRPAIRLPFHGRNALLLQLLNNLQRQTSLW